MTVNGQYVCGYASDPTLTITGSTMAVTGGTRIGYRGGNATWNMTNSTFSMGAHITLGDSEQMGPSSGTLNMVNSTINGVGNNNFHVGLRSDGVGVLNMDTSSVINMAGWVMYVGYNDDYAGPRHADAVGIVNMHGMAQINNPTGNVETGAGDAMSKGTVNMGTQGNLSDLPSMNLNFLGVGGDGGAFNANGFSTITTNLVHIGNGSSNGTMNMHDFSMMNVAGWYNVGAWSGQGTLNMDGFSTFNDNFVPGYGWHAIGVGSGTGTVNMSGNSLFTVTGSDYWATFLGADQWDGDAFGQGTINLHDQATMTQNPGFLAGHIWGSTTGNKTEYAHISISQSATLNVGFLDLGNGPDTDNYYLMRDTNGDGVNDTTYGPYAQHSGGTMTIRNSGTFNETGGDFNVGLWELPRHCWTSTVIMPPHLLPSPFSGCCLSDEERPIRITSTTRATARLWPLGFTISPATTSVSAEKAVSV